MSKNKHCWQGTGECILNGFHEWLNIISYENKVSCSKAESLNCDCLKHDEEERYY